MTCLENRQLNNQWYYEHIRLKEKSLIIIIIKHNLSNENLKS